MEGLHEARLLKHALAKANAGNALDSAFTVDGMSLAWLNWPSGWIAVRMMKCTYCGGVNDETVARCQGCGESLGKDPKPILPKRHSSSLFPRSVEDWTRSLAMPLFVGCVGIMLGSFVKFFLPSSAWRDAGPYIDNVLLPLLGIALAATCFFGQRG